MKNIIIYSLACILLTVNCFTAAAQADSIHRAKKIKDSIYWTTHERNAVPDTVHLDEPVISKSKHRSQKNDSLLTFTVDTVHKKLLINLQAYDTSRDSAHRKSTLKLYPSNKMQHDSLYEKQYILSRLPDSLKSMYALQRISYDSLQKLYPGLYFDSVYRHKKIFITRMDTLKRSKTTKLFRQDSLNRLYPTDSMHTFKMYGSMKLDSLKTLQYRKNIRIDSLRMKALLRQKKMLFESNRGDTADRRNGYRSRTISMEITCIQHDTVYISNSYKKIIIKTIPSQKMRLSSIVTYKDDLNNSDKEIFKLMGIEMSRSVNRVMATINTDSSNLVQYPAAKELHTESNIKRTLFIEVPDNMVLFLNSKFAQSNIESYVKDMHADLKNAHFKMNDGGNVSIKSSNGIVKMEDIKNADLNLLNTAFKGGEINQLTIVSHNSTILLRNSNTMQMSSVSDQYQLKTAGSITGTKNFGTLNIDYLEKQLVFSGANADVTIYKIDDRTAFINIHNKYASMQVPVYKLDNYSIYYEGSYRDVNKLSASAILQAEGTGIMNAKLAVKKEMDPTISGISVTGNAKEYGSGKITTAAGINKTVFEAMAGDTTGKHTKVAIDCAFCNVAFK